jgi:hypothetical protein
MACAYLFTALAVLGFPAHGSPLSAYIQWTSQTLIQLTMLSIIMVGQRVMEEKHQQRHHEHLAKLDAQETANQQRHDAHAARLDAIERHVAGKRLVKKTSKEPTP